MKKFACLAGVLLAIPAQAQSVKLTLECGSQMVPLVQVVSIWQRLQQQQMLQQFRSQGARS